MPTKKELEKNEKRRQRQRESYKKNPEKFKNRVKIRQQNNKEKIAKTKHLHWIKNKEEISQKRKEQRQDPILRPKILKQQKQSYKKQAPHNIQKSKEWRLKNPEKFKKSNDKSYQKHKQKIIEKQKIRIKENPETQKKIRIKYLSKKFSKISENNPDFFTQINEYWKMLYRELTRLIYKNKLPQYCEMCKTTQKLEIHHKTYTYPILQENLEKLCKNCHLKLHGYNKNPELTKKQKENIRKQSRRNNRKHLPEKCQRCHKEKITCIHHITYKKNPDPKDELGLCTKCHYEIIHNPYAPITHTS